MPETRARKNIPKECLLPVEHDLKYKQQLPEIVNSILASCQKQTDIQHLDATAMPSRETTLSLITDIESLLFPGYVGRNEVESANLVYYIGELVNKIFDQLSVQIMRCIRHECVRTDDGICRHCTVVSQEETVSFLSKIPKLREMLALDILAAYEGDPAAKSFDEIIFAYPGVKAVTVYRIAHELWLQKVPILPRIMTEFAHSVTGVDIHPGATIGKHFFIDHGTGVVVGETTQIGDNVQLYQGVTLGALRLPINEKGELDRSVKRHPTIQNNVTVYSGTTILGGDTVIGQGAVIGGNIWLTHSVPPNTKVVWVPPETEMREKTDEKDYNDFSI